MVVEHDSALVVEHVVSSSLVVTVQVANQTDLEVLKDDVAFTKNLQQAIAGSYNVDPSQVRIVSVSLR